jgi:hypothetical protein
MMEVKSLLELVLWKVKILNHIMFQSVQEVREYPVLDEQFDVNNFLMTVRITCGSEIVIPAIPKVIEFLG